MIKIHLNNRVRFDDLSLGNGFFKCPAHDSEAPMKALANSLITAIRHINTCSSDDPDADVAVLESIASFLQHASVEEIRELSLAAEEHGVPELIEQLGVANAES